MYVIIQFVLYRDHAIAYYSKSHNHEKLTECYYLLEDYSQLENLTELLPENSPLLSVWC